MRTPLVCFVLGALVACPQTLRADRTLSAAHALLPAVASPDSASKARVRVPDAPEPRSGGRSEIRAPAAPGFRDPGQPQTGWGGYIGAMPRYVRKSLDRATADRRKASATRTRTPPRGRSGPAASGEGSAPASVPSVEGRARADVLPTRLWFGPAFPNPSGGRITFRFDLPAAGAVRISILDIAGRVVDDIRTQREAGRHTLEWDAGARPGRPRLSGVCFARLEVNGRAVGTRRLVVLP
jgi:hypothetical protein